MQDSMSDFVRDLQVIPTPLDAMVQQSYIEPRAGLKANI